MLSGHFTLRSGRPSDTYFDKYQFESDPELLTAVAAQMASPDVRASLRSVGVSIDPAFGFTSERSLSVDEFVSVPFYRSFDVMPDGERILVVVPASETGYSR